MQQSLDSITKRLFLPQVTTAVLFQIGGNTQYSLEVIATLQGETQNIHPNEGRWKRLGGVNISAAKWTMNDELVLVVLLYSTNSTTEPLVLMIDVRQNINTSLGLIPCPVSPPENIFEVHYQNLTILEELEAKVNSSKAELKNKDVEISGLTRELENKTAEIEGLRRELHKSVSWFSSGLAIVLLLLLLAIVVILIVTLVFVYMQRKARHEAQMYDTGDDANEKDADHLLQSSSSSSLHKTRCCFARPPPNKVTPIHQKK